MVVVLRGISAPNFQQKHFCRKLHRFRTNHKIDDTSSKASKHRIRGGQIDNYHQIIAYHGVKSRGRSLCRVFTETPAVCDSPTSSRSCSRDGPPAAATSFWHVTSAFCRYRIVAEIPLLSLFRRLITDEEGGVVATRLGVFLRLDPTPAVPAVPAVHPSPRPSFPLNRLSERTPFISRLVGGRSLGQAPYQT